MRLALTILIGVVVLTFSWGWLMNVHYGYMSTDAYILHYLLDIQLFFRDGFEKAAETFQYLHDLNHPIVRPEFAIPTD